MLMSIKQMNDVIDMQPAKKSRVLTRKYLCDNLYSVEGIWDAISQMTDNDRKILKKIIEIVEKEKES
jgi:hypothetical protein